MICLIHRRKSSLVLSETESHSVSSSDGSKRSIFQNSSRASAVTTSPDSTSGAPAPAFAGTAPSLHIAVCGVNDIFLISLPESSLFNRLRRLPRRLFLLRPCGPSLRANWRSRGHGKAQHSTSFYFSEAFVSKSGAGSHAMGEAAAPNPRPRRGGHFNERGTT